MAAVFFRDNNGDRVDITVAEIKTAMGQFIKFSEAAFSHLRQDMQSTQAELKLIEKHLSNVNNKLIRIEPFKEEIEQLKTKVERIEDELDMATRSLVNLRQWKQDIESRHKKDAALIRSKLIETSIIAVLSLLALGAGLTIYRLAQSAPVEPVPVYGPPAPSQ